MVTFRNESPGRKIFIIFNYIFLILVTIICIFPILHILAISFSSTVAIDSGKVSIFPVDFNWKPYEFVIREPKFYTAFMVSVKRVILSVIFSMFFTVTAAYPLSKNSSVFKARQLYVWLLIIPMLFGGGLIPSYLLIKNLGMIDHIWALVIPNAVAVSNIILLQNFFKSIPDEISLAAYVDGASHWQILFRIMLPLSMPILATLILFVSVGNWNSWFDGMLLMNRPQNYPLQTYLQTVVVQTRLGLLQDLQAMKNISPENSKAAQIILAMLPILMVYPFLQKHFTKGIMLGSVKG